MSADNVATNSLGLYNHWSLIINEYLGKACVHTEVTRTLDLNGDVISETEDETVIYGAISPVSEDAVHEDIGVVHRGDLIAYFLVEDGVKDGEMFGQYNIIHLITYNDIIYDVNKRVVTAYDDGAAVVSKYLLRKIPDRI